ncbi:MCPH1 [Lepeophtheirus salmonis]|uniref:MCPH1 n=1 Tax=Lepeophtheirus salmonis TaxID=72036 RepID=A0A7R8D8D0_LEPSM|nr:MCPH1 [Lepeophtheirus salmonis]CAF3035660.1 MCPH1 [Lepeophtheirus salmonis]
MKSYNIIPSTPERSTPKRRSSLRSRNSYGEVLRVIETPNNNGEGVLDSKSVVEESPYGNLEAVCEERAQRILGDASEKDKRRKTSSVPQFLFRSKRLSNLPSENTFLQYVPGTQELSSTPIQSPKTDQKVRQWLMEGNEAPSPTTILSPSRRNVSSTSSKKSLPKNRIKKSLAQDKNEDKEEVCPSPKSSTSSLFFETLSTTPLHCPSLPKSHILKDIVAFVDVFDDLSSCVIDELKLLGASISSLLNKKVSHLIFKDGSLARYNKAKKLDIKIVSISWIEACKTEGKRVDEKDFPTISKEKYDSPTMALFIKRKNNRQRMMTLSTEEKYQRHVAKIRRRRKKEEKMTSKSPTKVEHGTPRPLSRSKNAQSTKQKGLLDQIIESNEDILIFPKTPPSSHKKSSQGSPSCTSILGDDFDTPLSVRVAKQFYANKRRSMLLNSDLGSSPLLGGSKEEEGQQDTQEYEISSDADPNRKRKANSSIFDCSVTRRFKRRRTTSIIL